MCRDTQFEKHWCRGIMAQNIFVGKHKIKFNIDLSKKEHFGKSQFLLDFITPNGKYNYRKTVLSCFTLYIR